MKPNIRKCSVLHTAPQEVVQALSGDGVRVTLNELFLLICDRTKTLGVVQDSKLTLSAHATQTIQKALSRLRGLYRFRSLMPEHAKFYIIQSMVSSVIYYCYPAFGNSISREDMGRIQKV